MRRRAYGPDPEGQRRAAELILKDPSKHPTFSERWARRILDQSKTGIDKSVDRVKLRMESAE